MARPKISRDKLRTVNYTIRLTLEEQKQLEQAAAVCGTSAAEMIRKKVFSGKFPQAKLPRIEVSTYTELKKIGVNLNLLTRLANAGRMNQRLAELLVRLWKQQRQIISLLLMHDSHSENR